MVVDDVGKVVGRDAVRFEQDDVLVVFRQLDVALDKVAVNEALVRVARAAEAQNIRLAGLDICFNLFQSQVAAFCPLTVVAEVDFHFLLLFAHSGQLFLSAEARISHALFHQLFGKGLVDFSTLSLSVRSIGTVVAFNGSAFVEVQAVVIEYPDDGFHTAFDSTLEVGVLDSQEENTVALVSQTLADDSAEQVAQMHEAGWAWCDTGYLCSLRKISWWVHLFDVLGCCCNIREEQLCKTLIIHVFPLLYQTHSNLSELVWTDTKNQYFYKY